ncbi:hypothetical protein [Oceaniglobus ichthyenteri]|uniref:hypothetical protein n=1 Tax=Oceaniglobus ichthyenteri TaxID=2136177 RepID=UPI000F834F32|nr:hypothetical protein [Oceaniglobus ichthyenteri]
MKNAISILFSLVLGVCLAFYGPADMAKADGGGAVFAIEICANAGATTVYVDADGNLVEPAADCAECLTCCQAAMAQLCVTPGAIQALVLSSEKADLPLSDTPHLNKRNTHPSPRGPPAGHVSLFTVTGLIAHDQALAGHKTRSDGRPLSKDADA